MYNSVDFTTEAPRGDKMFHVTCMSHSKRHPDKSSVLGDQRLPT